MATSLLFNKTALSRLAAPESLVRCNGETVALQSAVGFTGGWRKLCYCYLHSHTWLVGSGVSCEMTGTQPRRLIDLGEEGWELWATLLLGPRDGRLHVDKPDFTRSGF